MQKSFHIRFVRPFFKNIRKEMIRMPKVYFLDLGLRNFFAGNFDLFDMRNDKGMVLENAIYRQLMEKNDFDEIKFWRTIEGNEIDFVAGNNAFEAKVSVEKFKKKKYQKFLENYQKINFSIATLGGDRDDIDEFPVVEAWKI